MQQGRRIIMATNDTPEPPQPVTGPKSAPLRPLTPEAKRALAEAKARHLAKKHDKLPAENGGADGPEPTRYGDWEKGGLISDF